MGLDRERVRENVRRADTEDLLDRLTVFRAGMEPEALELVEAELRSRGVTTAEIGSHEEHRARSVLWAEPGLAHRCERCARPAVVRGVRWQRLFWLVPLFPRPAYYCEAHRPRG